MEIKQMFSRIVEFTGKMLAQPNKFWDEVIERKESIDIWKQFYLPFVVMAALASFLGTVISSSELLFSYAILTGLREAIVFVLQFYISVYIIQKLNVSMGGQDNKLVVKLIVGFSMVPFFLVSIFTGLLPFFYVVNILGLYGLYLFFTGVPKLFEVPHDRLKVFTFVAILLNFFIFAFLSLFFWKLLEVFY